MLKERAPELTQEQLNATKEAMKNAGHETPAIWARMDAAFGVSSENDAGQTPVVKPEVDS